MVRYYAIAQNEQGKIGQLIVNKEPGKKHTQRWTGKTYRTLKEAREDLIRLNGR